MIENTLLPTNQEVSNEDHTEIQPTVPLSLETLKKFQNDFYGDPKNELAQNVCTRFDPFEVAISRKKADCTLHNYNIKVESEGKPVTNQEHSGRCWLFAALNVMRLPFMKKYAIEEFEFSQSYLFFWDKIERSHYWLNNIVITAKEGEQLDGRLLNFLLKDPINDGGQWDMIVNLVNKYGVMPKKCFPESFSSKRSLHMNALIKTKLREYAKQLRDKVAAKASYEEIQATINKQIAVIYNIVATCLGTPPEKFTFEFYNKEKAYNSFGPLTPKDHDYRLVFNTEVQIGLEKKDRLLYGDSCMTHAMVFTAVGTDEQGNPLKFRVENSYGDKEYDKGYLLLTEPWFREFVFEVVIDKKYVPSEVLDVFKQEAIVLPAWDPMGTLACPVCSKE
ncbi:hypothetical protein O3G_MSEX014724 [Manduca sexta]|uniref:Bleomycin hydrolase n=1 Tax=Manduca sexta TaxID=7130 RepID=A0A922CYU5_MANSE|nr:hypothetical protein O3G_MSEX014724 [Manduca sexta]